MDPLFRLQAALDVPLTPTPEWRTEMQRHLLALLPADWEALCQAWRTQPEEWVHRLCDALSPAKHGRPACQLLLELALEGPLSCLAIAAERLSASQCLHASERALVADRLHLHAHSAHGHHARQHLLDLYDALATQAERPSVAEAAEFAVNQREALETSLMAACYYCMTVFPAAQVSEFTDGGNTGLCPYCGTDAVLASSSGYDFSPAGLQAVREFWFR